MVPIDDFGEIGGCMKLLPAVSPGRTASPANTYTLESHFTQAPILIVMRGCHQSILYHLMFSRR